MALIVKKFGETAEIIAYLHDTLEDTDLSKDEVQRNFGEVVAQCVEIVTDPEGPNRKARKKALHDRLWAIQADSPVALALVVKAGDRLANVRASAAESRKDLLDMYRREHQEFRKAVFRPGLNDDLISETDRLLAV